MPHNTSTNLLITGPKIDVERFVNAVNTSPGNEFNFEGVVPMPKEFRDLPQIFEKVGHGVTQQEYDSIVNSLMKKYGVDNWYDWCIRNWGTKWGAYDATEWIIVCGENESATATISYYTAWQPATQFFKTASIEYPTLHFCQQIADEGGGYVGEQNFANGIVDENYFDWDSEDGIETREALGVWHPEDDDNNESEIDNTSDCCDRCL